MRVSNVCEFPLLKETRLSILLHSMIASERERITPAEGNLRCHTLPLTFHFLRHTFYHKKRHTGTVGRTFKPELDRPSYPPQKYASSCPAWLPKVLQATKSSLLKQLPNDVQRLILSNLDYQFLIFLSTVNRHFYRTAHLNAW